MQNALRKLVVFLSLVILLLIGVHGVITTLDVQWLNAYDPFPRPQHIPWMSKLLSYTLILLLPLFVLLLAVESKPVTQPLISIKRRDGSIQVATHAIVKCIMVTLSRIPDVLGGRCNVAETRQGILVKIRAYVRLKESLPRVDSEIKARVRDTLTNMLGVEHVADVRVVITDIKMEQKAAGKAGEFTESRQFGDTPTSSAKQSGQK
jgi:uncharacterized alkaline shock family protein YloU